MEVTGPLNCPESNSPKMKGVKQLLGGDLDIIGCKYMSLGKKSNYAQKTVSKPLDWCL